MTPEAIEHAAQQVLLQLKNRNLSNQKDAKKRLQIPACSSLSNQMVS